MVEARFTAYSLSRDATPAPAPSWTPFKTAVLQGRGRYSTITHMRHNSKTKKGVGSAAIEKVYGAWVQKLCL